jgi:hypothetical protein
MIECRRNEERATGISDRRILKLSKNNSGRTMSSKDNENAV